MQNKLLRFLLMILFMIMLTLLIMNNKIWNPLVKLGVSSYCLQGNIVLEEDFNLDLCNRIPLKYVSKNNTFRLVDNNYAFAGLNIIWKECRYTIGVNPFGKILYIETHDKYSLPGEDGFVINEEFKTIDGIGFNLDYNQLSENDMDIISQQTIYLKNNDWFIETYQDTNQPKKFYKRFYKKERDTDILESAFFITLKLLNIIFFPLIILIIISGIWYLILDEKKGIGKIVKSFMFSMFLSLSVLLMIDWLLYKDLFDYFTIW